MNIFFLLFAVLALTFLNMAMDVGQINVKISASGPNGPAPNSGDGIPDGSGNDFPNGPNRGK